MTEERKKGRPVKVDAVRRHPSMDFIPGPEIAPMLEELATRRAGGNRTRLLRQLIRDAFKADDGESSGQHTRLVRRSARTQRGARTPQTSMLRAA